MKKPVRWMLGSITAFLVGSSCCWVTALVGWVFGSGAVIGLSNWLGPAQCWVLTGSVSAGALYLVWRRKKRAVKSS